MYKKTSRKKLRKTGKAICRLVALAFLFCVFGGVAFGQTNSTGKKYKTINLEITEDNFQVELTDDETGLRVISFNYTFENPKCDGAFIDVLKIPDTIQGFPVKEIGNGEKTFLNIERKEFSGTVVYGINRIELPDSVEVIKERAFSGSAFTFSVVKSFKSIKLPKSLKKIESFAFSGCELLETVEFPAFCRLVYIGDYAFNDCHKLNNVELPDTLKLLGKNAFSRCFSLDKIKFPKNKNCVISQNTFAECGFKEVTIPKNFVFTGKDSFFRNEQLKNVTFESPDTKVSVGTFNICDNLSLASQAEIKKHKTDNQ